jgi:translation initiation factor 2 subunit 2
LVKDDRVLLLRCDACGGHRPVRKRRARTEPAGSELQEGQELDVEIQSVSKRGDGVVRMGRYIMYVARGKPGQKVKVRITRISGSIVFTEQV